MGHQDTDICTYAWLDHASQLYPSRHHVALALYRDHVIEPSLRALDAKIAELEGSNDPGDVFLVGDLAELFQGSVGTYLLAVQSMWERGLRDLLRELAELLGEVTLIPRLQKATWASGRDSVQDLFERIVGVPIDAFDSYEDLDLLQCFGNAVRHGDGASARKIHEKCPNLWWGWFAPGDEVVAGPFRFTIPENSPKHPSFENITLKEEVLTQMIESVLWFWDDIDLMRCNSFRRKAPVVQEMLNQWPAKRLARAGQRVWSSKDSEHSQSAHRQVAP